MTSSIKIYDFCFRLWVGGRAVRLGNIRIYSVQNTRTHETFVIWMYASNHYQLIATITNKNYVYHFHLHFTTMKYTQPLLHTKKICKILKYRILCSYVDNLRSTFKIYEMDPHGQELLMHPEIFLQTRQKLLKMLNVVLLKTAIFKIFWK